MSKGELEINGNRVTMNLNGVLHRNIINARYFKQECATLVDYNRFVDEVYNNVTDLEPFMHGNFNQPSTAFCLLYKLFTLKCTENQMVSLLGHKDSSYIRGIGFLYLRYTCPPKQLLDWFAPYIYDEDPIKIAWDHHAPEITIGALARKLLTENKYFNTILPRIPVLVARDIKKKLENANREGGVYGEEEEDNENKSKQQSSKKSGSLMEEYEQFLKNQRQEDNEIDSSRRKEDRDRDGDRDGTRHRRDRSRDRERGGRGSNGKNKEYSKSSSNSNNSGGGRYDEDMYQVEKKSSSSSRSHNRDRDRDRYYSKSSSSRHDGSDRHRERGGDKDRGQGSNYYR